MDCRRCSFSGVLMLRSWRAPRYATVARRSTRTATVAGVDVLSSTVQTDPRPLLRSRRRERAGSGVSGSDL